MRTTQAWMIDTLEFVNNLTNTLQDTLVMFNDFFGVTS